MRACPPRTQVRVIRFIAAVSLLCFPAVCASRFTVEKLSWTLGFGEPPDAPLMFYLAGGGSFVYLVLSALLWVMSGDVERYRPLISFLGIVCLVGVPVYWWMNVHAGMPRWWMVMDSAGSFLAGVALLWVAGPAETKSAPMEISSHA